MAKKKITTKKEVSNNDLAKKIDLLLKNSEKTNERIEGVNTSLSKQIKSTNKRIEDVNMNLSEKIQDVSEQVEVVAFAVAGAQNGIAEVNAKMLGMNQKINGLNNRFDDLSLNRAKTDDVHKRFLRIEKEIGLAEK